MLNLADLSTVFWGVEGGGVAKNAGNQRFAFTPEGMNWGCKSHLAHMPLIAALNIGLKKNWCHPEYLIQDQ